MDFNKLVKLIVEPVLIRFGFTIIEDIRGIMKYDHNKFILTLSYDYIISYEVDVTLLFKPKMLFYGYNELKGYFNNAKDNLSATQIKDEKVLVKWLEEVNEFLNNNLNSIIHNSMEIQNGLEKIRQHQINIYESERNDRLLNESVDKYWIAKDYLGLVKFLRNYNGEIGNIIKKKYEFALKMLLKNNH